MTFSTSKMCNGLWNLNWKFKKKKNIDSLSQADKNQKQHLNERENDDDV